jgi:hypothetical protein
MKAVLTTLAGILATTLAACATQASQEPVRLVPPEVVLTGCIVQGSSPTVLIFDNATKDPKSAVEKGERYLLVSTVKEIDLRSHLNHDVRITGEIDMRVSAMPVREPLPGDPNRPADDRTLPRLVVKSVMMVSDKCSPAADLGHS